MGCSDSRHRSKIFGGSIEDEGVRAFLGTMVRELKHPRIAEARGLFRRVTAMEERNVHIRRFRKLANDGMADIIPFCDTEYTDGLFLQFLAELEPPIVPYCLYDGIIQAGAEFEAARDIDAEEALLRYTVRLRGYFSVLTPENRAALVQILQLLQFFLAPERCALNGLTLESLAHAFGPRMLRPGTQYTVQGSVEMFVTKFLIQNRRSVLLERNDNLVVELVRRNAEMKYTYDHCERLIAEARKRGDECRRHEMLTISMYARRNRLRLCFKVWKRNVSEIRGKLTVYAKLRVALEALRKEQQLRASLEDTNAALSVEVRVLRSHSLN